MANFLERKFFEIGLTDTMFFRSLTRRLAYIRARGDPEKVHEVALELLNKYEDVVRNLSYQFKFPKLEIKLGEHTTSPFGTAAGLDKNCDAINPLSHLFGFQEVGTIVINPREGNKKPRVAVDNTLDEIYNAQGFPSKGLQYAKEKLKAYRLAGGRAIILASICGIPLSPDRLDTAFEEARVLLRELDSLVDGFVWNPFSPNTTALTALRTSRTFELYGRTIKEITTSRPALVKMGPYEQEDEENWLRLVEGWMNGGGDGIVAVNTYMVPKEKVPSSSWGYQSAGRSGKYLQAYRDRAIKATRRKFPTSTIIATGGIDSAEQAWSSFTAGADALECYTPYTFHGFGLVQEIARGLERRLVENSYNNLRELLNKQNLEDVA